MRSTPNIEDMNRLIISKVIDVRTPISNIKYFNRERVMQVIEMKGVRK